MRFYDDPYKLKLRKKLSLARKDKKRDLLL